MNTSAVFLEIGLILLLILLNGVFAMAELALISSRRVRLEQRAENGDTRAKVALDLASEPTQMLSTVQIGITLISILTGAIGGAALADELAGALVKIPVPWIQHNTAGIAVTLIVIVITYFSLIIGELVPKRVALSNPEEIAARVARPMRLLSRLVAPLVAVLSFSTEAAARLVGIKQRSDATVTPEEITVMMEQGEQVGVFEEKETDIVEAVFRLGDLRAGALMTPRTDIDGLDLQDSLDENLRKLMDSPHTHLPVFDGSLDNVTGILRAKDLLARTGPRDSVEFLAKIDLPSLTMPAQFVPESMPAFQVLEVLRSASGNLSMVIDEFGGTVGMVTLFDVMEAMVGGISEQGEPVVPEAVQREDGSWLVEGMMRIDAFKDLLEIDYLPEEERAGFQTVGGFMMTALGSIPGTGQHFECCGWRFEVVDMDGRRVDKVLVSRII